MKQILIGYETFSIVSAIISIRYKNEHKYDINKTQKISIIFTIIFILLLYIFLLLFVVYNVGW